MFENARYLTKGIHALLPPELQVFLWHTLEFIPEPKDYFQVFRLFSLNGIQWIEHEQEQPPFKCGIVKKCAVGEYPKSWIGSSQAA